MLRKKFFDLLDRLNHKLGVNSQLVCDCYKMVCMDFHPDDLVDDLWVKREPIPWWLTDQRFLRLIRVQQAPNRQGKA